MAQEYVVEGAVLVCTLGVAPCQLSVLPDRCVKLAGKRMANITDSTTAHIATFGGCMISSPPKPCTPACGRWLGGKPDNLIQGEDALLDSSTVTCMAGGGMITIAASGQ